MKRFESKGRNFLAYVTSPRVHQLIASGMTADEAIKQYDKEVLKRVGSWMRSVRRKNGLSQAELAIMVGYGKGGSSRISEMERGKRPIPQNIRRIVESIDILV